MTSQNLKLFKTLENILGKRKVEVNKDLIPFITIRTKVKAKYFFEAKTREDLIKAKKATLATNLPLLMLAGGSNLAVTQNKINYLVVKNNYIDWKLIKNRSDDVLVSYSSGYPVTKLVSETIAKGWGGFQYQLGLPGSVGGAVFNNSKWTNPLSHFGDSLVWAYLIDKNGKIKKVNRQYFQFAYDYSILKQTKEILLEAVFQLKNTDPSILKKQSQEALNYRRQTQPQGVSTSGCFFKNISLQEKNKLNLATTSAGYLIDKAGLKGLNIGQFYISKKHANFIINKGNGKPKDLKKLLKIIKDKVKKKFAVELEEEVIVI